MIHRFNRLDKKDLAIRVFGLVLWGIFLVFLPKLWALSTIGLAVFQLAKCHRISSNISKVVNKINPGTGK